MRATLTTLFALLALCGCQTTVPAPKVPQSRTVAARSVAPSPDLITPTLAWTCNRGTVTGLEGSSDLIAWQTEFVTNRATWTANTDSLLATNSFGQIYTQHLGGAYAATDSFQVTLATTNRFWRAFAR